MQFQQLAIPLVLLLTRVRPAPVDEPVRVDLPVYDFPSAYAPLDEVTDHVAAGYAPSAVIEARANVGTNILGQKGSIVGSIISQKLHAATGAISHKVNNLAGQKTALLLPQVHAEVSIDHAFTSTKQYYKHCLESRKLFRNQMKLRERRVTSEIQTGIFSAPVSKLESAIQESESIGSKAKSVKENIQHIVAGIFQPQPIVDTISEAEKFGNEGDKFYGVGRAVVGGAEGLSNLVNSALEVPSAIFRKITRVASEKLNNLGGKLIGL